MSNLILKCHTFRKLCLYQLSLFLINYFIFQLLTCVVLKTNITTKGCSTGHNFFELNIILGTEIELQKKEYLP